ncbi:MAG: TadE/TadG family type IV pilus assembly protein [Sphingomonadaceae bacterium]
MTHKLAAAPAPNAGSLLAKLRRNRSGNIGLMAVVIAVPLMLMVDGSIDMGRVYLIKDQLQGACDAAVLTTRKSVTRGNLTAEAKSAGQDFFAANFADGSYGASNTKFDLTLDSNGAVRGTATATAPMGLLRGVTVEAPSKSLALPICKLAIPILFLPSTQQDRWRFPTPATASLGWTQCKSQCWNSLDLSTPLQMAQTRVSALASCPFRQT